jgi:hypothetical protein
LFGNVKNIVQILAVKHKGSKNNSDTSTNGRTVLTHTLGEVDFEDVSWIGLIVTTSSSKLFEEHL